MNLKVAANTDSFFFGLHSGQSVFFSCVNEHSSQIDFSHLSHLLIDITSSCL